MKFALHTLLLAVRMLAMVALAWGLGFLWFISRIPDAPANEDSVTDAIVVLTGGSLRVEYGLELIARERAKKLFVSGVAKGVGVGTLLRSFHKTAQAGMADKSHLIVLGYEAVNTKGNAEETAAWMHKEGYASLRLITANYHMPRSLLRFRRAMPEVQIVPDAVFPDQFKREEWWRFPGTARLIVSEYHKYLLALAEPFVGRYGVGEEKE